MVITVSPAQNGPFRIEHNACAYDLKCTRRGENEIMISIQFELKCAYLNSSS